MICIQRSLKGSNESSLLRQVVFKCRFYYVDLRTVVVSKLWFLKIDWSGHNVNKLLSLL